MDDGIRAAWWRWQGLDGRLEGASPADVLARTGWMRSVGGAGPYLGLHARAGLSREAIDRAVAAVEICELPSARGCTYVVPRADFALALRAGRGKGDEAEIATAKKVCGVTDDELDRLCAAVLDAVGDRAMDPKDLKEAVGGAVRHLGDAGKKRGMTTTLPLALGRLQGLGHLRRVPVNGRLDQQRYGYVAWSPSPLEGVSLTDEEVAVELARRFFRWIGLGTADKLAWWTGLTKTAAKRAIAALELVPFAGELATPELADAAGSSAAAADGRVRLVGSMDNLFHLRREVAPLVRPGEGGSTGWVPESTLFDLPHHAIVSGGALVGLWDFDADAGEIVARTWGAVPGLDEAVRRAARFVREDLGDARSFSLDSPASRGPRLAALRGP